MEKLWTSLKTHVASLQGLGAIVVIIGGIIGVGFEVYDRFFASKQPHNVSSNNESRSEGTAMEQICVSFEAYPDDEKFGANVEINNVIFQSLDREGNLFVNHSSGEPEKVVALQFMGEGLIIDFPKSANLVKLKVAEFASPVALEVLDGRNHVLEAKTIDRDNSTELLRLRQETFSIDKIRLSGGSNEGGLVSICAQVSQNS